MSYYATALCLRPQLAIACHNQACSGKFHPIVQHLFFDSLESLPDEPIDPEDLQPVRVCVRSSTLSYPRCPLPQHNCRYDAQIAVFGAKMQEKINNSRYFIVSLLEMHPFTDRHV